MQNPTAQVTTVSTVTSGAQVMSIDAEGMGTVLSILSNMYSDGSLAVVREYACNAYDSHVEAGNPDPILVSSPSFLNPTLVVQDFGVGLSKDEMLNVYAKYGASTKRNTNDQIGAFGIGAKSAFTVGTQFVVTAVKDGEQTVALFALDDNGAPTVNIVSHGQTDEPNGVKVEIGVRDVEGVQSAIDRLFSTWKPGTVLVDGVEPATVWAETKELAEDIHVTWREDRYDNANPAWLVVMGGVPYKLPDAVIASLDHRQRTIVSNVRGSDAKVILTVPIGSVDITPSREDLRVTDKTTALLNQMVEKFNQLLPGWIAESIDGAKTIVEAMILRRKLQSRIGSFAREHLDNATWRGRRLSIAKVEFGPEHEYIKVHNKRGSYYEKLAKRHKGLQLLPNSEIERHLFVLDTPKHRVRSVQLAAKPYLQAQDKDTGVNIVVAVTSPRFQSEWFDTKDPAVLTMDYETFVAQYKPTYAAGSKPGTAQYPTERYKNADTLTAEELNDLGEPILYLTSEDHGRISFSDPFLNQVAKEHTVIYLKATQKATVLKKRVPLAEDAMPHIREAAKKTLKSLSQNDLDTMAAIDWDAETDHRTLSFLEKHRNGIVNPVVLDVLATYSKVKALRSQHSDRVQLLRQAATFLGSSLDTKKKATISLDNYRKLKDGLPLLDVYVNYWSRQSNLGNQHIVKYINDTAL
jgi:hypothetical protein